MKPTPFLAAAALALTAQSALAQTQSQSQTQTIDFNWDGLGEWQVGSFAAFDDMGGDRQLTGVTVALNATARWDVTALNFTPEAFTDADWFGEGSTNFNIYLGDFFGGTGVERISGSVLFTGLTGDLGPGQDDPIGGQPGDPSVSGSFEGDISNSFDLFPAEFAQFLAGDIEARLLSFSDAYVDGPDGAPGFILLQTDLLTASGSMSLTYHYVPAPAGLALLGALAPVGLRRRR